MSEQIINNEKLPLLITRGAVVFPNTYLNIDVGRLFSVAALQKSLDQCASKVIVATQKDISINEPEANDVSLVGCLCNIDTVKEINGIFRIRVSALQRVKLIKVLDDEYNSHPSFQCEYELYPLVDVDNEQTKKLSSELFEVIADKKNNIPLPRPILFKIEQNISSEVLSDLLCNYLENPYTTKQYLLEESSVLERLKYGINNTKATTAAMTLIPFFFSLIISDTVK